MKRVRFVTGAEALDMAQRGDDGGDDILFVTDDRCMREGGKTHADDRRIIEHCQQDEELIDLTQKDAAGRALFKSLGISAARTHNQFTLMAGLIVGREEAKLIRRWRVKERATWRWIAQAAYDKIGGRYYGNWAPPSNQLMGMALCDAAARTYDEDYMRKPWN